MTSWKTRPWTPAVSSIVSVGDDRAALTARAAPFFIGAAIASAGAASPFPFAAWAVEIPLLDEAEGVGRPPSVAFSSKNSRQLAATDWGA